MGEKFNLEEVGNFTEAIFSRTFLTARDLIANFFLINPGRDNQRLWTEGVFSKEG